MDRAIKEWLLEKDSRRELLKDDTPKLTLNYTINGCMLLLPQNAFQKSAWAEIQRTSDVSDLNRLYELIAKQLKVTHIAITRPIPPQASDGQEENVLRAPSNFTPVFGDFGHATCNSPPTEDDFANAMWVTAKQNGIYQTWAPRWTMFSRGNISEKGRLLALASVQQAVDEGKVDGRGSAAVDLYAGIGYFAFSYLKAGVTKVLCWDINPWSLEGLRWGAKSNKWSTMTCSGDESIGDLVESDAELVLFQESNEEASGRIEQMRQRLPPIRHVNCGLLPTSQGSWQTALDVLDKQAGGWIHVHENFAVKEIEQKAGEVRHAFQSACDREDRRGLVELEHVNRLKSYAPGVMHCVLDIHIPPSTST